ncbi:tetratricopeptide repeat protein [Leptolyngbya sp. FACHB-36]|uniref:tetratricopeptide repeat protein n=1 Tax=Leptolyngbya sp. FACHB-36 TaxID=2692808 RepID=UPI001681AFAB|nr:tetratricopeptide repeat protein [Leptolyngbya sp. FACHB-36]MBD2020273.1 tetratricopeptide repeat protein [Leptolyngbya sp. FACHB-36]
MGASITVDRANFDAEVLQKSHEKPVLVDFFAHWCGPCQLLKPMLEKLVQEYDFVLAKVDIDASPDLAQTYGVQGVPDVRIVHNGHVNKGFVGVLPEPKLRELLVQLSLKSAMDETLEQIYATAEQGDVVAAQAQLDDLLTRFPDDRNLILEASNFYMQADQIDSAEALLSKISEYDSEYGGHAKTLRSMLQFKQLANQAIGDHPRDPIFQQAVQAVLAEDYETALTQLLEIVRDDRRYRNDGARKAMLSVFDLLGDEHSLTKTYRKQLTMALY